MELLLLLLLIIIIIIIIIWQVHRMFVELAQRVPRTEAGLSASNASLADGSKQNGKCMC